MKFTQDSADGAVQVVGYARDHVRVAHALVRVDGVHQFREDRLERSAILAPRQLIPDWRPLRVDAITADDVAVIIDMRPQVVVLGSGAVLKFPAREVLGRFADHAIGLEVMDTYAACRTYNVLVMEQREVVAALIIGG